MQLGMIGLGRMGANMVKRLTSGEHQCVVFDVHRGAIDALTGPGISASNSIQHLVSQLARPRSVWLMVPAANVDQTLAALVTHLEPGDIIIDGGNSHYHDDIRRGAELKTRQLHFVDVGTSGGVAGLQRGYCLMAGGDKRTVDYLSPLFATLAPGADGVAMTPGRDKPFSSADQGYLYCGAQGAGHFVKMVHNGIEYGLMAAYAEGLNILRHANVGNLMAHAEADAETTPLRHPEHFQYEFDLSEITELWRRGSVISSWLLDMTAAALLNDAQLDNYAGRVSDSGEGRWTLNAAIDEAVPTPVLGAALYERFSSRGNADFADKVLSAMRHGFGGHVEKTEPSLPLPP